jgi:hypothetical protein
MKRHTLSSRLSARSARSRSPRATSVARAAGFFCALVSATATLALGGTIEGQVFDRQGQPLAGVFVEVLHVSTPAPLSLERGERKQTRLARAETGEAGFFRVDLRETPARGEIFVRCDVSEGWDGLRYAAPEPDEVGDALRARGYAVAALLAEDARGWPELRREIERAGGPRTKRGTILRSHGLPPETLTTVEGRTLWRYPHVTYVFEGETLVETRREARARTATQPRGAS